MRKLFSLFFAALCYTTIFATDYALPGKFTVNDKGDQVQFHNAFMRHITENTYVTSCPSQMDLGITKLYYDFFSWGTGDKPNYWGFVDNFVDWGDNLCCDIEPHIWRTLSADEWQYILSGREHAEYLCGLAKVTYQEKDIKVLMLFPDDIYNGDSNDGLNLPDGIMFSSYKNEGNKFSGFYNNAYTSEEWTKLEEAGAVAFPETGGVDFVFVDEYYGEYDFPEYKEGGKKTIYCWTSTPTISSKAMALVIQEGKTTSAALTEIDRDTPCPVRLVKDITTYTVTFLDWDGTELLKETVEEGKDAKGPETDPTREGYIFTGWDKTFTNITSDLTVTAQYKEITDEIYGVLESDGKTLTLYYDKEYIKNGGKTDWAMKYYESTTKVILDESVKEARPDNLEYWFADFNQLTEVEHLDYLNTSDVTNMNSLFLNCYALTELDLSAFDTKKVESMGSMFGACTALKELNLNSFDVPHVTDMWGMFKGCTNLKTIHCDNDWSEQLPSECDSEEMFEECTSLVGGKGTAYSEEHTDGAYAHPDEGESKPGYFTPSAIFYTVTYYDWDLTVLGTEKVEEGHDAKGLEPEPTREGYTFTGWSKPLTNITSDLSVQALYEVEKVYYTVTYYDWDLTVLGTEKVEEGHDAKGLEPEPTREGYTFTGWSKPLTNITSDLSVQAQYKENPGTGVETITNDQSPITNKLLRDGQIFILRGDKLYTIDGRLVR